MVLYNGSDEEIKIYEYKEQRSLQQTELLTECDENQVTSKRLQSQQCPHQSDSSILNIPETTPISEPYYNKVVEFEKCKENMIGIGNLLELHFF